MPENSKRVWGYVTPDADLRIRMLAIAEGSIGQLGAAALGYFFGKHRPEHERVIGEFFETGRRSAWPGLATTEIDTSSSSRVWAIISADMDVRFSKLVLAYGLRMKQGYVVVTQALYEFLLDHQEEHDRVLAEVYATAQARSWNELARARVS